MNKKVWYTIQYILILAVILGVLYVTFSLYASNWDPMQWTKDVKEGIGLSVFFAFLGAAWIQGFLND